MDGNAIAVIFNGAVVALAFINPRFFWFLSKGNSSFDCWIIRKTKMNEKARESNRITPKQRIFKTLKREQISFATIFNLYHHTKLRLPTSILQRACRLSS